MNERVIAPIHPGRILKEEFLEPLEVSPGQLAIAMGVPSQRIYDVVAGKRGITLDTALRLAKFFGTSHQMWLGLQAEYEFQKAQDEGLVDRVAQEVRPLSPEQRKIVVAS
ncbi:MAG: HigA family addiction module antitoxin [Desulfovibrio sp.]|uniref:HigA family addiction module antitoxin n=1 Tax=Desulfovibrio sp. 7SRBS1 TaxID=3378064 RepID=UPI003B3F5774